MQTTQYCMSRTTRDFHETRVPREIVQKHVKLPLPRKGAYVQTGHSLQPNIHSGGSRPQLCKAIVLKHLRAGPKWLTAITLITRALHMLPCFHASFREESILLRQHSRAFVRDDSRLVAQRSARSLLYCRCSTLARPLTKTWKYGRCVPVRWSKL